MKQAFQKHHLIDIVFTLALFCLFTASALCVVLIGANVYKSTVSQMEKNNTARTAMAYVSQKIHRNDRAGGICLATYENTTALCMESVNEGSTYVTLIYLYEGSIRELFMPEDTPVSLSAGQKILEVSSFELEEVQPSLLRIRISPDGTKYQELYVHTRTSADS